MKFEIVTWSIGELIDKSNSKVLNLMPPYQRNFIWSTKDQEDLIKSINKQYPLPSIFLYKKGRKYEVVDGQQRIRTILNYYAQKLSDPSKDLFGKDTKENFLNYQISITIITSKLKEETIEDFYSKVNKSGLKLNKPELSKAENFDTKFLALNEELASRPEFVQLSLFTETTRLRMNDVDLVSELTALIIRKGATDKKDAVDQLYSLDITDDLVKETRKSFLEIVDVLTLCNNVYKISKTRFRQRNDIYTLFQFFNAYKDLGAERVVLLYRSLIILGQYISPANEACPPLREYARNCITQSNSKEARLERFRILSKILIGDKKAASFEQKQIIKHFALSDDVFLVDDKYQIFDYKKLDKISSYGNVI